MTHLKLVQILEHIMTLYGVDDPKHHSRKTELVEARQFYFKIAYQYGYTLDKIGSLVGKNHSTVCVAIKKVNNNISVYTDYCNRYKEVEDSVYFFLGKPNKRPDYNAIRKEIERLERLLDGECKN